MAFPHVRRERVRFRDCDTMGHVNNAVYSTYLEEARIDVLGGLSDFILARVEIDFRSELRAGEEIEVGTRAGRLGTKSFELEHEIRAAGRLAERAGRTRVVPPRLGRGARPRVGPRGRLREILLRPLRLGPLQP